jgi:hydroxyacyl-ACP dehydratase HTD2-like protein with hotdog domain
MKFCAMLFRRCPVVASTRATPRRGNHTEATLWTKARRRVRDTLTAERVQELNALLKPFLPSELQQSPTSTTLPPSYHFAFFPTSGVRGSWRDGPTALEDGYEAHFAPTRPFKRRVWTQGTVRFGEELLIGEEAQLVEDLSRCVERAKLIDVWIERMISSVKDPLRRMSERRCLRYLVEAPSQKEDTVQKEEDKLRTIEEVIRNALFTFTFTPTRELLTEYSRLTDNAHRIHLDREYAQKEGYPDILVQGSLSVTFILTILTRLHPTIKLNSARYTFYRPLYVASSIQFTLSSPRPHTFRCTLWTPANLRAVDCLVRL